MRPRSVHAGGVGLRRNCAVAATRRRNSTRALTHELEKLLNDHICVTVIEGGWDDGHLPKLGRNHIHHFAVAS